MGVFEAVVVFFSAWWLIFLPILSAGTRSQHEAGTLIVRRGDAADALYLVGAGEVAGLGAPGHVGGDAAGVVELVAGAVDFDGLCVEVDRKLAGANDRLRMALRTADNRMDAGDQFFAVEWLGDVIVCAKAERAHL